MVEEKSIQDELSSPILLTERIRVAIKGAKSFKVDCAVLGKHVDRLSQMLRSVVRIAIENPSLYERPVRRIVADVSKNLKRVLTLIRRCKRRGILRRFFTITRATDFRKVLNLLEASIGDMKWLLNILDSEGFNGGIFLSLPPIASNDPIFSWVWSFIAAIQMGPFPDRVEAANGLASLALDNDRNKKIIVEEGGIPPLLKLLKKGGSPDAQIAASTALFNLATDRERVRQIGVELGIPVIVKVLSNSLMSVQIRVANLVSRMAEYNTDAQEEFATEDVIRPLVTLLSFETSLDDHKPPLDIPDIHYIVQSNRDLGRNSLIKQHNFPLSNLSSTLHLEGSNIGTHNRKEWENEKLEMKLKMKIACTEALWKLSKGSVSNSRRITETKCLICFAKLIEKEEGELQQNCLMAVMEIASVAEFNANLRREAFRTNSPASKAIVDQLLRVIQEETPPLLQIHAIKSIGSLARTFPARETRVIGPLVSKLSHKNTDVAIEAAIALGKFSCPENFLHIEHSNTIIEFNGVSLLLRLLRASERAQLQGMILLCYLALHVGNIDALENAMALTTTLVGAVGSVLAQHPSLKELLPKAIFSLELYRTGIHPQRLSYTPQLPLH